MKMEITHHSYIIDFMKVGFGHQYINEAITKNVLSYIDKVNIKELEDWQIEFRALYNKVENIRVYKKARSNKDEKYKTIVIHIPIPSKENVSWGVEEKQYLSTNIYKAGNDKYVDVLETLDYTQYSNYKDYIVDTMTKAIIFCFQDGFTINGKKVKIKK